MGMIINGEHTTSDSVDYQKVVFSKYPPHIGSQRCSSCGGWIETSIRYTVNGKLLCPVCMNKNNKENE